jgi:hypothetical protein
MNPLGTNTSIYTNSSPLVISAGIDVAGSAKAGLSNIENDNRVFSAVDEPESNLPVASRDEKSADANETSSSAEERAVDLQQQNERRVIEKLASRDREVRAHEQAHAAVGGQYAGAASYSYQRGPDGINYAVGGEVPISLPSGGGDPRQVLAAAEQVRRAALAPAEPSAQDRSVAAAATVVATLARIELAELAVKELQSEGETLADKGDDSSTDKNDVSALENPAVDNQTRKEQQLADLQATSLRRSQLSDQLITLDQIRGNPAVGSIFDQRA